ncbi:hypothetical protein [Paremcibacter congregatus]|uniref:hypothetical protein n=1 Tax=Paremcibacter congregatus TaxID=2043170 RepID=UPI0030EC64DC|tara:strand:- start:1904 stop:3406 length:1503 start_codon:yes stop_codon:yes gene_type:complete
MSDEICTYQTPDGKFFCQRKVLNSRRPGSIGNNFCRYHNGGIEQNTFDKLIEQKDGDWFGFEFGSDICIKIIGKEIDFPINLNFADIHEIQISESTFRENFLIEDAHIRGSCKLSGKSKFCKNASFQRSIFDAGFRVQRIEFSEKPNFSFCEFKGAFLTNDSFSAGVDLSNTIFHESVRFDSTRDITIQAESVSVSIVAGSVTLTVSHNNEKWYSLVRRKAIALQRSIFAFFILGFKRIRSFLNEIFRKVNKKYHVSVKKFKAKYIREVEGVRYSLAGEVNFRYVTFLKPERVILRKIDMSCSNVEHTDFRGIKLVDVKWPKYGREILGGILKRNAIFDELQIMSSNDFVNQAYLSPMLESQYRNLRMAMEENKDFISASDFYIGEMENKLRQRGFWGRHFSILSLYGFVSKFATRPARCIFTFFALAVLYAIGSSLLIEHFDLFWQWLLDAFSLMTLRQSHNSLDLDGAHEVLDLLCRIIGPVMVALTALSIRNQVKRN